MLLRTASIEELADLENRAIGRKRPDALPQSVAVREQLKAYTEWLSPYFGEGSLRVTQTYRDGYGKSRGLWLPSHVVEDFIGAMDDLRPGLPDSLVMNAEVHNTGRDILHYHGVVGGCWSEDEAEAVRLFLSRTRGFCSVKLVDDREKAVGYAVKEVVKRGSAEGFYCQLASKRPFASRHDKRMVGSLR